LKTTIIESKPVEVKKVELE